LKNITHIIYVLVGFFIFNKQSAQTTIILNEQFKHIELSSQLEVAEDKTKQLDYNIVKSIRFEKLKEGQPNFGFNNSSYWFKGIIVNPLSSWQSPILSVANPNLDIVNLFVSSRKTGFHKKLKGDLEPFSARGDNNKYFRFNLKLLPNDTLFFYLNVQNSGEQFHVPLSIGTAEYFQNYDSDEQLVYGIYFGFILFVLLLNGFFYYVLKDRSSLFYIGYLFTLLFLQLSLTGFGFKYIWPDSVFLANHANPIFASISMYFLLLFCQDFLNIKSYLPRINQLVNLVKYYLIVVMLTAWIDINSVYVFSVLSINGLSLILILFIIPVSIYILKQNYKPARFFITAFIALILSVLMFVLKNAGILPSNAATNYGLQLGSALEVLLLTLAVIDKFNQFKVEALVRLQEVNDLKTKANFELEQKVEERTKQLNEQALELQEKNSEILSSIRYAKRIQDSLLPSEETLTQLFDDNYFVLYKPKDIVSGDFYWASSVKTSGENPIQLSLAAVVDCTGHGVPGAFLSIVGNNFLKQSLSEKHVNSTAEALDFLNEKIISTLNQNRSSQDVVRDGMDVSLIAIDYKAHKLYYSGANNPIYIIRQTENIPELIALKATKQAIGSIYDTAMNYELQIMDLQAGDTIYLFSDGFADQFGGDANKKYNYKRFKETLLSAFELPMPMQQTYLDNVLKSWKGNTEQTDDVCVMGIKI
jgi:two-component system, sensor histidine kinase LadS